MVEDTGPLRTSRRSVEEIGTSSGISVGETGFEPATPASRTQCSTGLSYSPSRDRSRYCFGHRVARAERVPRLQSSADGVGFEPTLAFRLNTLSKRAPSAARPPIQAPPGFRAPTSGEGGIRTLEGLLGPNALAGRRLKPLGHLSRTSRRGASPAAVAPILLSRAGDRARTGDPQLGKLMLYQLSYARVVENLPGGGLQRQRGTGLAADPPPPRETLRSTGACSSSRPPARPR